ncbi:MAG: hypothetical protein FIB00_09880 [Chloroflexi bacterium]|nr:hypothetical protein [Chloroflexota bacterium]
MSPDWIRNSGGSLQSQPDAVYTLLTLGSHQCINGENHEVVRSPVALVLLTYLCLHEDGIGRRDLSRAFWPRTPEKKARHSLSQVLYNLHSQLPALSITSKGDRVILHSGTVVVDVTRLLQSAAAGRWHEVVETYRGDFLSGTSFRFPPEIDSWRDEVESSVRSCWSIALTRQADEAERVGDWVAVERCTRLLVNNGREDKRVYTQLVASLVALGRKAEAKEVIAQGAAFAGEAWREDSTAILEGDGARIADQSDELRFVGRASEFSILRTRWEHAKRGRASLILINGEAGIGKSRLALQLQKLAVIHGARLLQSRCYEAGHRVSYAPLETIAADIPADVVRALPASYQRLLSVLKGGDNGLEESIARGDHRYRDDAVIHAFEKTIGLLTRTAPLVLAIEDCQWIDAATADLLIYLSARLRDTRVLFLCIARNDGYNSRGLQAIAGTAHDIITVRELSAAESTNLAHRFITTRAGHANEKSLEYLVSLSGGNPFFLIELLSARHQPSDPPEPFPVPASVKKLFERKFAGLSSEARALVSAAAVLDHETKPQMLRKVSGLPRGSMMLPVEELVRVGFVKTVDTGALAIRHDLIREAVVGLLSPRMHRMLHARAAALFRRRAALPAVVAYHADRAGMRRWAWAMAIEAGNQAVNISAGSDALHWYEMAYRNAGDEAERVAASERILQYALNVGAPERAQPYLGKLRVSFGANKDEVGLLSCRHVELVAQSLTHSTPAPNIAAEMVLGADIAERHGAGELAVRMLRDTASLMQHSAAPEELLGVVRRMLTIANKYQLQVLPQVYAFAALAHSTSGSRSDALELAEAAVRMAVESGRACDVGEAFSARGAVRAANGLLREGIEDYRHALTTAEEFGAFHRRSVLEVNYGVLLWDTGAVDEAEEVLASARGMGARENPFAVANLAALAYETG